MSRVYRACLGTLQGFQVAKCSFFFFFFFHFCPFWHFCKSIIIFFLWPFWLDSHFKRFFHLMAISIIRKKINIKDEWKEWFVKALQRKIPWKSEVTTQVTQPPRRYFCLTYLSVSVKSYSFYGNNFEKGPSGPLSDDRNESCCTALRHFKMAGVNIHWVFETGFLSFLKTGVRIFEIYCLNTCLSAQNHIVKKK